MRTHRIAGVLVGLGLVLSAACSSPDISQAKFQTELYRNLKGKGFTPAQVSCITKKTYDTLTQKQIDQLYKAEQENQVSPSVRNQFDQITRACTPKAG